MEPISINGLIEKLSPHEDCKESRVYFDFCGLFPVSVGSWRGVYADPTLHFSADSYWTGGKECRPPSIKEFIKMLRDAIDGREFTGWKGGEFSYTGRQILHVDNDGECNENYVHDVDIDASENYTSVLLITKRGDTSAWWERK